MMVTASILAYSLSFWAIHNGKEISCKLGDLNERYLT